MIGGRSHGSPWTCSDHLDANIISEPLRPAPDTTVVNWLDVQALGTLYVTSPRSRSLRFATASIAALPRGARQSRLRERFEEDFVGLFTGRILDFDEPAATACAHLRADARRAGRAIGDFDALIAAIALTRRFTVATRDTSPFEAAAVLVVNPFRDSAN